MKYRIAHAEVVRPLDVLGSRSGQFTTRLLRNWKRPELKYPRLKIAMLNGFDESCSENELLEIADCLCLPSVSLPEGGNEMKYYINHCEITQSWTTWEVEADSYEEAVQKLNQTGYDNLDVSAAMTDPNNQTCEYEDYPPKPRKITRPTPCPNLRRHDHVSCCFTRKG